MSVHTSLRRKALAFPVALVVALGAAGFAAAPAYAAPVDPTAEESVPVEVTLETEGDDESLPAPVTEEPAAPAPDAEAVPEEEALPEVEVEPGTEPGAEGDPTVPVSDAEVEPAPAPGDEVEPAPAPGDDVEPAPAPGEAIPFTVLSPAPDATTLTRTVLFAGTGTDGATVTVTDADGAVLPGSLPATVTGGAWTTIATYADDAEAAQTVIITLTAEGAEPDSRTVSFTLPDPDADVPFEVLTPASGETLPTRTVAFSGTGDEGAIVTVLGTDGLPLPGTQPVTVVAGVWLVAATYADDAPASQTATVTLAVEGEDLQTRDVSFELPAAPALPAPVITSPAAGEVVTGTQVTFRGTGQPGAFVGLLVVPTALAGDVPLGETADGEMSLSAVEPSAAPAPADPADPILVAADGTWSVTVALAPEDYTVIAVQASDEAGTTGLSDPSAPVAFTLRAAPAVVPAVAGSGSDSGSGSGSGRLAATGGEDVTGLFGISILVMLAGAATVVVSRRRATQN